MTNEVRRNAQEVNGQKFFFFAIFRTFAMDTTLLRLIFIQNVKKGKNQPTLMHIIGVFPFSGYVRCVWLKIKKIKK